MLFRSINLIKLLFAVNMKTLVLNVSRNSHRGLEMNKPLSLFQSPKPRRHFNQANWLNGYNNILFRSNGFLLEN